MALVGDGVGYSLRHLSLAEARFASAREGGDNVVERTTDIHGLNLGTGCDSQRGSAMYPGITGCARAAPEGHYAVLAMSLEYASDHLTAAVRSLATSEDQLARRLQTVWDEHVQMVWMKPCLTRDLLREFRDLWHHYTAPSDDRQSTTLRDLTRDESVMAIDSLVSLANRVALAAVAPGNEQLATLADLG